MTKPRTRGRRPFDRRVAIEPSVGAQPARTTADEAGIRKPPRAPWKTALIAFSLAVLAGAIVAGIITAAKPSHGRSSFERGNELGNAIAPFAIAVAVIAYVIADRRRRRDERHRDGRGDHGKRDATQR
jgi:hypothetical protein